VLASAETDSETALLLNESSAGVCVEPESAEALVEAITSLYENPAYVSDMGDNGRKWIENYYSRSVVIDAYDNMVRQVSG
jgi:glycosyltransferase involved in cell wall biosynthesis